MMSEEWAQGFVIRESPRGFKKSPAGAGIRRIPVPALEALDRTIAGGREGTIFGGHDRDGGHHAGFGGGPELLNGLTLAYGEAVCV